jgi:tRNA threonylcarbamoyladenosine biosynthesis protein TsaB
MIVAIESASTDLSLAVGAEDGEVLAVEGWRSAGRGAHELLPHLLALLTRAGYRLEQATAFAVGSGPGSFTGLRVGMSLAKGMALALGRPIVGVPSLEAWLVANPGAAAAVARAGAREAYLLLRGETAPRIVDREELPSQAGVAAVAAAVVAPGELAEAFGLAGAVAPTGAAAAVAAIAATRLAANPAGDDLAHLEPAYLRPPRGAGQLANPEAKPWR